MKYAFGVATQEEWQLYQEFLAKHQGKIMGFIRFLADEYAVSDFPEYLVLSNFEMATQVFRESVVPAYTNDTRMVMTPDLKVWQTLYLEQLAIYEESPVVSELREYYEKNLSDDHLLQIIGHELAHNSELFLDDAYEKGIWFEEGMVEYISRRYFLTPESFEAEKQVNQQLIALFEEVYGTVDVEQFGQSTYEENMATIFVHYWKSVLLIDDLVTKLGSVKAVFATYHAWAKAGQKLSLSEWFDQYSDFS